jgi:hypothetical protein
LRDQRMLLQEFGENIGIEERERLWHQAAGSRKNRRRSKVRVSTCVIWSAVNP